jgi:hypothetical protein
MKVIAVDASISAEPMLTIRKEIKKTPPPGWTAVFFRKPSGLLAALKGLPLAPGDTFDEIEIVSEGSPLTLDKIDTPFDQLDPDYVSPTDFGVGLNGIPGIARNTVVFLSGCNTGLADDGVDIKNCLAQVLADASRTLVRGAAGFISGLHATKDEAVFKFDETGGFYEKARNAKGAKCWNKFQPS